MELERLYPVFSYLPFVKEYPNSVKTILEIPIGLSWENCLLKGSSLIAGLPSLNIIIGYRNLVVAVVQAYEWENMK